MELLKDNALVLSRKYYNESNILVTLFTKTYGKISCISYRGRVSKKKELYALTPTSYIYTEIEKNGSKTSLVDYRLLKNVDTSKSIGKVELCLYIVYVLDKILEYNQEEKELYERIEKIYDYIEEVDEKKVESLEYVYKFISRFLKRILIDLGIYFEGNFKKARNTEDKVCEYEGYINTYFNIDLDYRKIITRRVYKWKRLQII